MERNAPVIEFVRHTLLLGSICFDIYIISNPVWLHKRRQLYHTTLCTKALAISTSQFSTNEKIKENCPGLSYGIEQDLILRDVLTLEATLEHVARSRSVTEGVRHI